jgi:glucan phosphoethanolaminetransferase (alkaline phosphatase superfamily)
MVLIRFLYAPGMVFAELKKNSWVLPLAAAVLISMLGWILIVSFTLSVVGEGEMLRRILETNRTMAADLSKGHYFRWLLLFAIAGAGGVTARPYLLQVRSR